jgi:PAS domain S-box-containing protein
MVSTNVANYAGQSTSVDDLCAVLSAAQATLPQTVAARLGKNDDLVTIQRLGRLLADCLHAVKSARPALELSSELLGELGLDELSAFRSCVYDTVEARRSTILTVEARRLADWFSVLSIQVTARQQQRSEEALRHSERRFRLAIDRSTVVAYETDLEGRFTWLYNSKLPQLVGADMLGRRINELMTPAESAALEEGRRQAMATGVRSDMELPLYIGSERIDRLFSFEVLRDASGAAIGFAGSSVDTTEIRRTQAELSRAVAFREQLMGILSHDLRNPVSAVRGLAGLLQLDPSLPSKVTEGLARIDLAGRRMSEMIETILDFTRIQFHHSLPVSRSDMDFGELCRNVVDEAVAGHPGREISLEMSGDLRVHWDYARMAQVVSNLLGNALTHGDEKAPVQLIVRTEPRLVTLDVTNRGPTISPEHAKTLFEPFVQGHTAGDRERDRGPGLGLGLYIAKQIVASHGGTITAQSRDGTTTFAVCLPSAAPAAPAA